MIDPNASFKVRRFFKRFGLILLLISVIGFVHHQFDKSLRVQATGYVTNVEKFIDHPGANDNLLDQALVDDEFWEDLEAFSVSLNYSFGDSTYMAVDTSRSKVNGRSLYTVGDSINIFLDPSKPTDFYFKQDNDGFILPLFGLFFGFVFFMVGWLGSKKINIDEQDELESSRTAHWTIKYGFYILGVFLIYQGWYADKVDLGFLTLKGYDSLIKIQEIVFIFLGVILMIFGFILRRSFVVLKFSDDQVFIRRYGSPSVKKKEDGLDIEWPIEKEIAIDWDEINSIKMLHFIYPPTYILSKKHKFYLFSTKKESDKYRSESPILDYFRFRRVKDNSALGKFLKVKKEKWAVRE